MQHKGFDVIVKTINFVLRLVFTMSIISIKHGIEYSLFLLLIFIALLLKAQKEVKKLIKQTKNALFLGCNTSSQKLQ